MCTCVFFACSMKYLLLFTSDLEALENYTGTPFLHSDSDILLDSPDQDDIGNCSPLMYLVHHLKCSILTEPSVFLFNPFFQLSILLMPSTDLNQMKRNHSDALFFHIVAPFRFRKDSNLSCSVTLLRCCGEPNCVSPSPHTQVG